MKTMQSFLVKLKNVKITGCVNFRKNCIFFIVIKLC